MKKFIKIVCLIFACFTLAGGVYLLSDNFAGENLNVEEIADASHGEANIKIFTMGTDGNYSNVAGGGSATISFMGKKNNVNKVSTANSSTTATRSSGNPWWWTWRFKIQASSMAGFSVDSIYDSHCRKNVASGHTHDINTGWWGTARTNYNIYFRRNKYDLRFDKQFGNGGTNNLNLYFEATLPEQVESPTRIGYTFAGYYTDPNNGIMYYDAYGVRQTENLMPAGDLTLYAQWFEYTYTVVFDGNGNTDGEMEPQELGYDKAMTLPENKFIKEGYYFAGWALEQEGEIVYKDKATVLNLTEELNGEVILYAQWLPIEYYVRFHPNGTNGGVHSISAIYDNLFMTCDENTFSRTGYRLTSWNRDPSGKGETFGLSEEVKNLTTEKGSTVNLYAIWSPNLYSITFIGNGNTAGEMELQENVAYDQSQYLYDNKFVKEGYYFAGWATSANGKVIYSDGANVRNLTDVHGANVNLYAQWKLADYGIMLDGNGGRVAPSYLNVYFGDEILLPMPEREGYTFIGWVDHEENIINNEKYLVPELGKKGDRVTFTASWEIESYYHIYDSNGGSLDITSQKVIFARNITLPTPEREGYTFTGWQRSDNLKIYRDAYTVEDYGNNEASITFTAQWQINKYRLSLSLSDGVLNVVGAGTYEYGHQIIIDCDLDIGHHFTGWKGTFDIDSKQYTFEMPAKNVVLTATAEANRYTIVFNGNNNTAGEMAEEMFIYGIEQDLYFNRYIRTGYHFIGWSEGKSDEVKYQNHQTVKNITIENNVVIELFAVWEKNEYRIIYDSNGGEGEMQDTLAKYDEPVTFSQRKFTNPGYNFLGWSTEKGVEINSEVKYLDKECVQNLTSTENGSTTLYAVWGETWAQYAVEPGGKGLQNDPYLVDSAEKLAWISSYIATSNYRSVYVKQTAFISLYGHNWYPIGRDGYAFTGVYNGQGFPIIGLSTSQVKDANGDYVESDVGLFGQLALSSRIINLNVYSAEVYGHNATGIIAGSAVNRVNILSVYVTGNVISSSQGGGIVGYSKGLTIAISGFKGDVICNKFGGSMIGFSDYASIIDSFAVTESNVKLFNNIASAESCVYIANHIKGYTEDGDFTNWVITNTETPLPRGLTWLGNATTNANIDEIKKWANS